MKKNKELEKIRNDIDKVDEEIVKLLNKRTYLAQKTTKLKGDVVFDPKREKQVLNKISAKSKGPITKESMMNIYHDILSSSREAQKQMRISFFGPVGSHTHMAAERKFGAKTEKLGFESIPEVFLSVIERRAEYGIIPLENSFEGSVGETLDQLIFSPVKIVGEISRKIDHSLLSNEKKISKIKTIYSHPQAIAQSKNWIQNNLKDITIKEVSSTSLAAQIVSKQKYAASISSETCSNLYNLNILKKSIQDDKNNSTIFIVIAKEDNEIKIERNDKVSIVFTLPDKPGSLFECLKPLKENHLNLTKIQSRPSKKIHWDYNFFVDILVGSKVNQTKKGLDKIKKIASYFKILGAY